METQERRSHEGFACGVEEGEQGPLENSQAHSSREIDGFEWRSVTRYRLNAVDASAWQVREL
jgi:hypothetical protein